MKIPDHLAYYDISKKKVPQKKKWMIFFLDSN